MSHTHALVDGDLPRSQVESFVMVVVGNTILPILIVVVGNKILPIMIVVVDNVERAN